jgi:single-strand DNA-binding protein
MKLIGLARLGRDVELRTTPQGEVVCNLALAYNYGRKDSDGKQQSTWVEAALWGKRADALQQYLVKGQLLCVTLSDLHIETYQKNDGTGGSKLIARVDDVEFAGSAPGQQSGGQQQGRQQDQGRGQDGARQQPAQGGQQGRQDQQRGAPPQREQQRPQGQRPASGASSGSGFDDMDGDIPFICQAFSHDQVSPLARRMSRYGREAML